MNGRIIGLLALILLAAMITNLNATYPPESCLDKINNDPAYGDPKIDCADRQSGGVGALTCPAGSYHPDACPNGESPFCVPGQDDYDMVYKAGWICPSGANVQLELGEEEYRQMTPESGAISPESYYGDETAESDEIDSSYYYYYDYYEEQTTTQTTTIETTYGESGAGFGSEDGQEGTINGVSYSYPSDMEVADQGIEYPAYEPDFGSGGYEGYNYDESGYNYEGRWHLQQESYFPLCGDGVCSYGEGCYSDCGPLNSYNNYNYNYFDYYDYGYAYGYCYVNSPTYAIAGDRVPIQVVFNGYAPYSVQVDCGDGGSTIAYRNGYYSYGNVMYAYCHYTYEGIFFPSAYASGTSCYSDQIIVRNRGSGGGGGYYYPTPTPTPQTNTGRPMVNLLYPTGGEIFEAGERIGIEWDGTGINNYRVLYSTNGGLSWQVLQADPYYSTSVRWTVPNLDINDLRIKVEGHSATHSLVASDTSGYIEVVGRAAISPTPYPTNYPTPTPGTPECALTAFPSALQEGESAVVTANYYSLARSPNTISIDCGNGQQKNAVDCFGTTGSCAEFCNYQGKGTFTAKAIASGTACAPVQITVSETSAEKCTDGTSFGDCSEQKPKYCDDGILVDRASICGCPSGKIASGNRCIEPFGSCTTAVSPPTVRANERATVSIDYEGIPLGTGTAQVICGNGDLESARCTRASELSGSCTAECVYGEESYYPKKYAVGAKVKGISCSSANVQVSAPSETTGTLLAKVSECVGGDVIEHAKVRIQNNEDFYTDSNGQLKVSLEPGAYNLEVSKPEFNGQSASVQIKKGQISTSEVCLKPAGCSISAELVRVPDTDDSNPVLLYQIRITNNLNSENEISLSYSSAFQIEGDQLVVIGAKESKIVNVLVRAEGAIVGRSYGMVAIKGEGDCAKNIELPISIVGGLSLELQQHDKESFADRKVCFDFLVRNRGENEGVVTLNFEGDFEGEFNVPQFFLTSREIRDGLQFCANVPSGESGSHAFTISALSPISDAYGSVAVKVLDTGDFETDIDGACIIVHDYAELYPVTITNDVADGDYAVTLRDNEANARATPSVLYNFKKGTSRTVYISADPDNIDYGDSYMQLVLKRDGSVALQQDVCIASATKRIARRDIFSQLSQGTLNLQAGASASTTLTIRNTGTRTDDYFIRVQTPLSVSISESSFTLDPEEEKKVTIKVSASATEVAKRYSIPIKIYSGRGQGGVIYDGPSDGGYGGIGTAFVKCGNGRTVSLQCDEGSSSCSAVCKYTDTGSYTLQANVGNEECRDNSIRVIPENSNGCAISAESVSREDTNTIVKVRYSQLPREPTNEEILISCGNGNSATADDCDGLSGTCSATCSYSSKGTFTINANTGGVTCTPSEIEVTGDSEFCSISSPGLAEEDDTVTIGLKYRNVYFGGQFYQNSYSGDTADGYYDSNGIFRYYDSNGNGYYDSYGNWHSYGTYYSGSGVLLKTENLVVIVGGGGAAGTITPGDLHPDAVEVRRVLSAELPSKGKANVAATFKNMRDYKLKDIALLVEGLPQGVTLTQVAPFEIEAGSERTIYFRLEANGAKEGVYHPTLTLRFDSQSVQKEFELKIAPETEILKAEIKILGVEYAQEGGSAIARLSFEVTNKEGGQVQLSPIFRDMPQNWSAQVDPSLGVINAGETLQFNANITAKEYEQKSYTLLLELRSPDGRRYSEPVAIEFQKLGIFSGLFTFFGALGPLQVLVILAILALAVFAVTSREKGKEKDEDDGGPSERLKSISEEIRPMKGKQTTLLDERKYKKKGGAYEATEEIESPEYIEMDDADVTDEDALKTPPEDEEDD